METDESAPVPGQPPTAPPLATPLERIKNAWIAALKNRNQSGKIEIDDSMHQMMLALLEMHEDTH